MLILTLNTRMGGCQDTNLIRLKNSTHLDSISMNTGKTSRQKENGREIQYIENLSGLTLCMD